MLDEPYRWVEAVRNRRDYLEDQLEGASPVVATTWADGVLLLTSTPGPRKLFEVYDQIAFAGVGHPADIEKLRKAVIDIAHVEAFNLSASDVSLQRLVHFGLGPLLKGAFDEIFRSPFIARVLVAELDPTDGLERFYTVDAEGSFAGAARAAAVAGTAASAAAAVARLQAGGDSGDLTLEQALRLAVEAWAVGRVRNGDDQAAEPGDAEIAAAVAAVLAAGRIEAAVLDRGLPTKTKFRLLGADHLREVLARFR